MISQKGYLLSYLKYGENDAIVHFFLEEMGYQSYFLKGIYSKKDKKKALLSPLLLLNLVYPSGKNKGLPTLSKIELAEEPTFYSDIKANSVVFFIADFLNQILRNEPKNTSLFLEIQNFILSLSAKNYASHLVFLCRILTILGLSPLREKLDEVYLDPVSGTYSEQQKHPLFDEKCSAIWYEIQTALLPYEIKISTMERKKLLECILVYYQFHFPEFKTLSSLEIILEMVQ